MTYRRKITFVADEGYQAIILDLVGKNRITAADFNNLVKGLLLDAHIRAEGAPVLLNKRFTLVCIDPFYKGRLATTRPVVEGQPGDH